MCSSLTPVWPPSPPTAPACPGPALRPAPEEHVPSNAAVAACEGDLLHHPGVEVLVVRRVELVDADDGHLLQQLDDQADALRADRRARVRYVRSWRRSATLLGILTGKVSGFGNASDTGKLKQRAQHIYFPQQKSAWFNQLPCAHARVIICCVPPLPPASSPAAPRNGSASASPSSARRRRPKSLRG